jgi:methylaspartate mutase epsilon subunit
MLKDQKIDLLNNSDVKTEIEMEEMEVKLIVDKVLELGEGDPVWGCTRYEAGFIDRPFSPSRFVHGKIVGVRDSRGALRYLDTGDLPFNKQVIDFHKQK